MPNSFEPSAFSAGYWKLSALTSSSCVSVSASGREGQHEHKMIKSVQNDKSHCAGTEQQQTRLECLLLDNPGEPVPEQSAVLDFREAPGVTLLPHANPGITPLAGMPAVSITGVVY